MHHIPPTFRGGTGLLQVAWLKPYFTKDCRNAGNSTMAEDEWKALLHPTSQTQQKYAGAHHMNLDYAVKLV